MSANTFDSFRQRLPPMQKLVLDELARKMAAVSHRRPPGPPMENWWRWIHQASNHRLTPEQSRALAVYALLAANGPPHPTGSVVSRRDGSVRRGVGGVVGRRSATAEPARHDHFALRQFMEQKGQMEEMICSLMKAQASTVSATLHNLR